MILPKNGAGTEHKLLSSQFCLCHRTKTSRVLSLHIPYSSAFYWLAKMPAELHCVILHGACQGYILISDLLQLSLLWSSCCGLPAAGPSPTAHPTRMPFAWSKTSSVQGPALATGIIWVPCSITLIETDNSFCGFLFLGRYSFQSCVQTGDSKVLGHVACWKPQCKVPQAEESPREVKINLSQRHT